MDAIVETPAAMWPPINRRARLLLIRELVSSGVPRKVLRELFDVSDTQISVDVRALQIRFKNFERAPRHRAYSILLRVGVPPEAATAAIDSFYPPIADTGEQPVNRPHRPHVHNYASSAARILAMPAPSSYELSDADIASRYRPNRLAACEGEQCHHKSDGGRCAYMRRPGSLFCEHAGHSQSAEVD